ncbi:hypothetical protein FACS1894217_00110 [Clostridia bacterium]|nr:hypothetical protein FACS1894217_00110 [Clostridia bacterium]
MRNKHIFAIFMAFLIFLTLTVPSMAAAPGVPSQLIPIGHSAGIQFKTRGLMVVGYTTDTERGGGLKPGDFITKINGEPAGSAEDFGDKIEQSGDSATLTIIRGGTETNLTASADGGKLGVWVRDTVSGIGTLTFYDPASGMFGALGHGICEGKLLVPIASGDLLISEISEVRRGRAGQPGELKGAFTTAVSPGSLILNSAQGLFGILDKPKAFITDGGTFQHATALADKSEVEIGEATMLCNVRGDTVEPFKIEITAMGGGDSRDFTIRVTDESLLAITGGIVQGMSGSPILQNGKLIGAVTHVLVSDPKKGFGIFISNMLEIYKRDAKASLTY